MGVYSTEAAAYAANIVPVKEATVNSIQFAIDSYRSDLQLFEAMIERDVCNALNESGVVVLEEEQVKAVDDAAKKGIITKIKEAIEKIIAWIKNAFNTFKNKVLELVKADKKIWLKYGSYLENKYDDLKMCPIKGTTVNFEYLNDLQSTYSTLDGAVKAISEIGTNNLDDAKSIYEKFMNVIKVDLKEMGSRLKNSEDKPIIEKLNKGQYADMISDIKAGYKQKIADVKKWYDVSLKQANIRKGNIKVSMNNASDKEEVQALHNQYTIVNMEIAMIRKFCDVAVLDTRTRIGIERSNFLLLGNWAAKQSGVNTEAADFVEESYIIEETSNEFVEGVFALV